MAFVSIFCRLMRCAPPRTRTNQGGKRARDDGPNPGDDLTAIEGIGVVTQDRLYKAGIKTYDDLSAADPATIIRAAGQQVTKQMSAGWIARARELKTGTTE